MAESSLLHSINQFSHFISKKMDVDMDNVHGVSSNEGKASSDIVTASAWYSPSSVPKNHKLDDCESHHVIAPKSISSSVTVSLHPLVILHISEHWTRIRAQAGKEQKVFGALIGIQKGRNIEVMNAFELKFVVAECGDIAMDLEYYNTKEEQCKYSKKS